MSARIGPTRTKILFMVINSHARGRPFKIARAARILDCVPHAVHEHLHALRKRGLIDWQDGRAGTVVPLCRFILPEDLAAATDGPAPRGDS